MVTLDREIVYRHMSELESALVYLKGKRNIAEKKLVENIEERFAIERAFHLAIQNLIDVGNHILAALHVNNIETYADIPVKLAEAGIISKRLSKNLANMAKFRNILVHEYVKVESKRLVSFLRNNLSDFEDFAVEITKYLDKLKT